MNRKRTRYRRKDFRLGGKFRIAFGCITESNIFTAIEEVFLTLIPLLLLYFVLVSAHEGFNLLKHSTIIILF